MMLAGGVWLWPVQDAHADVCGFAGAGQLASLGCCRGEGRRHASGGTTVVGHSWVLLRSPACRTSMGLTGAGLAGCVDIPLVDRSAFAGFRFPPEVIVVAVRWYLRYGLSYRDVEELLVERGVEVDHVTVYRWVQRFTPLFADAARRPRPAAGHGGGPSPRQPLTLRDPDRDALADRSSTATCWC